LFYDFVNIVIYNFHFSASAGKPVITTTKRYCDLSCLLVGSFVRWFASDCSGKWWHSVASILEGGDRPPPIKILGRDGLFAPSVL